jgi:hypothetical protein
VRALCRTVFGDVGNAVAVTALVAVAIALVAAGHAAEAGWILPPLVLAGVGWLAAR